MLNGSCVGVMWLWPLVLGIGIVALVWCLVRASSSPERSGSTGHGRAREILHERFARGEITEQELRERMRVLHDH
jgi:putative membrane protein